MDSPAHPYTNGGGYEPENTATTLKTLPSRRRLRFRVAAGVALGLATLLSIFVILMGWGVRVSTEAVYHDRLVMARASARSVDDLLKQALHQIQALSGEVAWDEGQLWPLADQPLLARLVHVSGTFESLSIMYARGEIVWSWGPPDDIAAAEDALSGILYRLHDGPEITASRLPRSHPPIAIAITPLQNSRSEIIGAMAGTLHLAHMGVDLVSLPSDGSGLHIEIVDRDGHVLGSSAGGDVSRVATNHLQVLSSQLKNGTEGVALHEVDGQAIHLVAFAPFEGLEGGVFIEEPVDIALTVPLQFQRIGVFIGSTAILLLSMGAWWYTRRITQPLDELALAAQSIAAGHFDQPILPPSVDELGMLARSFEQMRVRLKAAFEDRLRWESQLEQQVKERTEAAHQLLDKVISAQEDERKRIARELHDGTAQDIAALIVALDSLEASLPPGAADASFVQLIRREAQEALQEVRRLLRDLRPSALDDLGLTPALRSYIETRLEGSGIEHNLRVLGPDRRLSPALETTLFRIAQEAINNAAKHSRPQKVEVVLEFTRPNMILSVEDNGEGFDPSNFRKSGSGQTLGLASMHERAALAGGTLVIRSEPGVGTTITATIPVVRETNDKLEQVDNRR